jgi:hypothetical protein
MPAFCNSRMCRAVMRRPASTSTSSPAMMSKLTSLRAALRHQLKLGALAELEGVGLEEHREHVVGTVAERAQQHGRRQLAAAVDAHEDVVLGIELEVEPGAAVGDDPRGEEQLAGGVGLALVVVEEDARANGAAARR